eukprot:scaffold189208_cov33-Tisochrysis_lutea.AAC.5
MTSNLPSFSSTAYPAQREANERFVLWARQVAQRTCTAARTARLGVIDDELEPFVGKGGCVLIQVLLAESDDVLINVDHHNPLHRLVPQALPWQGSRHSVGARDGRGASLPVLRKCRP